MKRRKSGEGGLKSDVFCDHLVKEHFHKGLAVTMALFLPSFFPGLLCLLVETAGIGPGTSSSLSGQYARSHLDGCPLTKASSDPWWVMYSAFPLVESVGSSSVYDVLKDSGLFPFLYWSGVERSREDTPNSAEAG